MDQQVPQLNSIFDPIIKLEKNAVFIPHVELGWATGIYRRTEEVRALDATRHNELVFDLLVSSIDSSLPVSVNIGRNEASLGLAGWNESGKVKDLTTVIEYRLGINELKKLRVLFPELSGVRTVLNLRDLLPPVPEELSPHRLSSITFPLGINDLVSLPFSVSLSGLGLGHPSPTPSRRKLANDALLLHILRERCLNGMSCTEIGEDIIVRISCLEDDPNRRKQKLSYGTNCIATLDSLGTMNEVPELHYSVVKDRTRSIESVSNVMSPLGYIMSPITFANLTNQDNSEERIQLSSVPQCVELMLSNRNHVGLPEQPPNLGKFLNRIILQLTSKKQSQVIIMNGMCGSGKTFAFHQCVNYILSVNDTYRKQRQLLEASSLRLRTRLDAALFALEAFGSCQPSHQIASSGRFLSVAELIYCSKTLTIEGARISLPFVEADRVLCTNLHNSFRVLTWLHLNDDRSQQRIMALEDSLMTLGISSTELSCVTSVLAAILVLRNPDADVSQKDQSKAASLEATAAPMSLKRLLSANPELEEEPGSSGGHWLLRAASKLPENLPPRSGRRLSLSLGPIFENTLDKIANKRSVVEEFQDEGTSLEACAMLLEVDVRALSKSLSIPDVQEPSELIPAPVSTAMVRRKIARRALARFLYHRVVEWLVDRLNHSLMPSKNRKEETSPLVRLRSGVSHEELVLMLIDPPGFERVEGRPSDFEALLINGIDDWISNIRLQHYGIAELRRSLMNEDLVEWVVMYPDTSNVPDKLFGDGGILDVLATYSAHLDLSSPAEFQDRLMQTVTEEYDDYSGDAEPTRFKAIREGRNAESLSFVIAHYGGKVKYSVHRWIDKCTVGPSEETIKLLERCKNPILRRQVVQHQALSRQFTISRSNSPPRNECSLDNGLFFPIYPKLKYKLDELFDVISTSELSNILCVRPSVSPSPSPVFDGPFVLAQLRALHIPGLCQMRCDGGVQIMPTQKFLSKYKTLGSTSFRSRSFDGSNENLPTINYFELEEEARHLISTIAARYAIASELLTVGSSSVFGKNIVFQKLDDLIKNFEGVSLQKLQDDIVNAQDLDPYREKLEKQLEPYVDAWENAKSVAGTRRDSILGEIENKAKTSDAREDDNDQRAVHFLWPEPIFDNATTGTNLMTYARFLDKIANAADALPHDRRPSNLQPAREALSRMKIEAEVVARAELLANDRFVKLHPIRDLCVQAQKHTLWHLFKTEEALGFPRLFSENTEWTVRHFCQTKGWDVHGLDNCVLESEEEENDDSENLTRHEDKLPSRRKRLSVRFTPKAAVYRLDTNDEAAGLLKLDVQGNTITNNTNELTSWQFPPEPLLLDYAAPYITDPIEYQPQRIPLPDIKFIEERGLVPLRTCTSTTPPSLSFLCSSSANQENLLEVPEEISSEESETAILMKKYKSSKGSGVGKLLRNLSIASKPSSFFRSSSKRSDIMTSFEEIEQQVAASQDESLNTWNPTVGEFVSRGRPSSPRKTFPALSTSEMKGRGFFRALSKNS